MSKEEFLGLSLTVSEMMDAIRVILLIAGISFIAFVIFNLLFDLAAGLSRRIRDRIVGVHRDEKQSFCGSIPLRDCPCCGSAPTVIKKYRKLDIGRVYCRGCGIGTDEGNLSYAFLNWNRRPYVTDVLSKGDYEQIIEYDKRS